MNLVDTEPSIELDEDSFYNMANLFPKHTGLPFVVWISTKGRAKHDVRVKVSSGLRAASGSELVSVGIRPTVQVFEGEMTAQDLKILSAWIELNRELLIQYWNEEIDTVEVIQKLKTI